MAIDGLTLAAVAHELQSIVGGRTDKISQPEKDEIIIGIRAAGENKRLLISASSENYRIHLTNAARTNPAEPPMFCMLLRKRLSGGRILAVKQQGLDRVIDISIEAYDDFGELTVYTLCAELTGRHSNIVLIDRNGIILDAVRHVSPGMSSVRVILPGAVYVPVPGQEKQDPREASAADFTKVLAGSGSPGKLLSAAFSGLSPAMADELIECAKHAGACGDADKAGRYLAEFYSALKAGRFEPALVLDEYGDAAGIYPFVPDVPDDRIRLTDSISEALDEYYSQRDVRESLRRKSAALSRIVSNNIERCEKKLVMYEEALQDTEKIQKYRFYGELLTANAHAVKKGAKEAALLDYYKDPPEPVIVPLDEKLSASANAQKYYKLYQKARTARDMAKKQHAEVMAELRYLEGQADNVSKCTVEAELNEIKDELTLEGYLRPDGRRTKAQKAAPSRPMHYISSDGFDIFVGKNNRQNDELTLKTAEPSDIWLHTKEIPGSHVIIKSKGGEVPSQTLFEAACLAAWYSKARGGSQIPVDYTLRKFVKKPSGAKPGMVIYTNQSTAYITPLEGTVKRIRTLP